MRVHRLWLAGLAALLLPTAAAAQDGEGPQMFFGWYRPDLSFPGEGGE